MVRIWVTRFQRQLLFLSVNLGGPVVGVQVAFPECGAVGKMPGHWESSECPGLCTLGVPVKLCPEAPQG